METVRFSEHVAKLVLGIDRLFDVNSATSRFSDIEVRAGSETYYCHKLVLQLNSDHFANHRFETNVVDVKEIEAEHFRGVLQFMYTGAIGLSQENVEAMLAAAVALGMPDLTSLCFEYLDASVTGDRAIFTWLLANKYEDPKRHSSVLALKCRGLVLREFERLRDGPTLMNASEEIIKVLSLFLKCILN